MTIQKRILENREHEMLAPEIDMQNELLYVGNQLIVLKYKSLYKNLF